MILVACFSLLVRYYYIDAFCFQICIYNVWQIICKFSVEFWSFFSLVFHDILHNYAQISHWFIVFLSSLKLITSFMVSLWKFSRYWKYEWIVNKFVQNFSYFQQFFFIFFTIFKKLGSKYVYLRINFPYFLKINENLFLAFWYIWNQE